MQENDRLKRDLQAHNNLISDLQFRGVQLQKGDIEQLERELKLVIAESERLKDEDITLKIRIAELESELMEERQRKEIRLETTIRDFQHNVQGQYMDYKLKFDEMIMVEKEKNNKLRLENQRFMEDIKQLKRQLMNALNKNEVLEKDNYNLQNELDKESLKVFRMAPNSNESRSAERTRVNTIIDRNDEQIRNLQRTASQWENKAQRALGRENMLRMQYESEIARIKGDNDTLLDQLKRV